MSPREEAASVLLLRRWVQAWEAFDEKCAVLPTAEFLQLAKHMIGHVIELASETKAFLKLDESKGEAAK